MQLIKTDETAVEALRKRISGMDLCILVTHDEQGRRNNRPMAATKIDDEGYCWFFASKSSGKIKDIAGNDKLQVIFANPTNDDYVEIQGVGTVVCDEEELERKWSPLVSEWFPDGAKDPEVCLVRVEITNIFYWDELTESIQRFLIRTTVVDDHRLAA